MVIWKPEARVSVVGTGIDARPAGRKKEKRKSAARRKEPTTANAEAGGR
jgi:hypothetical protein